MQPQMAGMQLVPLQNPYSGVQAVMFNPASPFYPGDAGMYRHSGHHKKKKKKKKKKSKSDSDEEEEFIFVRERGKYTADVQFTMRHSPLGGS